MKTNHMVAAVLVLGLIALAWAVHLADDNTKATETACRIRLRAIAHEASEYAKVHGSFPFDPKDVTGRAVIASLTSDTFTEPPHCPFDPEPGLSYEGFPAPLPAEASPQRPIAWDRRPHRDGTRFVVSIDGKVTRVKESDFAKVLESAR